MSEPIPTTCMRCAIGCGHLQHGADRGYGLAGISGDPAHPTSGGLACGRGLRETAEPDGEWLTRPLIRKDGELMPTSWDTALGVVVERLAEARARDLDRVAVLGSGQQTNETVYLLGSSPAGRSGSAATTRIPRCVWPAPSITGTPPRIRSTRHLVHKRPHNTRFSSNIS